MNDKVSKAIETIKQGYILDPNRILADYRKETAEIRGYHGRELLELLQNAVDELGGTEDRSVYISQKDGILKICNNGNVFTYDGFISLMYSNLSPKHNKAEYIGNKGTGFRSILNWADSVRIYSADFSLEFSDIYATELLAELMTNDTVNAFYQEHEDVRLATLVAPRVIKKLPSKNYDTEIEVNLKNGIVDRVINQLKQLNTKTLLFLENLEHLTVEIEGDPFTYRKTMSDSGSGISRIKIATAVNSEITESEEWLVISREGNFEKQKYGLMIAYKPDMSVKPNVLYSYFKTKVQFPVPALVHATFDLNADRNHLAETEANKHILKAICDTLVELALLTAAEIVNYAPLGLLSTIGEFPIDLSWDEFSIRDYYFDAIAANRVLPTVNGTYISFNERPRFYDTTIADYLAGEAFGSLMPYTENSAVSGMLKAIAKYKSTSLKYKYSEITNGINTVLPTLTVKERAALWLIFIKEYGNEISQVNKPSFALDAVGKTVNDNQQVFLPTEGMAFPSPPSFTKIVFLNRDLVTALRELRGKEGTLRSLANELSKFNVREYNLANIINVVISRLRSREHQASKKTRGCYEDTIEWLWKLWNANVLKNEMTAISAVPLINRNGTVKNASDLYWGRNFGNEIVEELFVGMDDYFVGLPRRIALSETSKLQYVEFLSALGVSRYPRKVSIQLRPVPQEYKEVIYSSIKKYPLIAENNHYQNTQEFRSAYFAYASVITVERIEEILDNSSTKSIISWIRNDESLWQILTDYEPGSSRAYVSNNYQQKYREVSGEQLASYIRFVFATSNWIEVDGKRYSPRQCIFANKVKTLFAPLVVSPDLDLFIENQNRKIAETSVVQDILARIGAAAEYSELEMDTFYSLLLKLPEVDADGDISKALYTSVLKSGGLKKFDAGNHVYKQFLQVGKVYCKSTKSFETIKSVYYLTEKTVSREILKDFNLIAIPNRQSQENIKRYFGVSPLKIKGSVVGEPIIHPDSASFEQDFNDFICYAFCLRVDTAKQSEISTVKALRARLCTHINADYGKGEVVLGENSYIRGKNCVYVQAPIRCHNLKQLKSNVDFCSAISELFMTAIDIQDDTLYGYVRSLYEKEPHNRNAMILHDFDDLGVLERSRETLSRTQSEKEMFIAACILIGSDAIIDQISGEIDRINFSDFPSMDNAGAVINILKLLSVDVEDFNEKSEILIDFRQYYSNVLNSLIVDNEERYKNGLFASLKSEALNKKRTFLKQYHQFRVFQFTPMNSVKYDCWAEFENQFGSIINAESNGAANLVWKTNKDLFIRDKDVAIVNDMLVDSEYESLLYFGIFDVLNKAYNQKKADINAAQEREATILKAQTASSTPIIPIDSVAPIKGKNGNNAISNRTGSRMAGMKRERNISDWGAFAERLVYDQMRINYNDVVWVSENAKKDGVNPDGIGGLGYDLKYTNANGKTVYVEIKSAAGSNITFVITENELNFAEEHSNQYEVILVTSVMNDEERKVYQISNLFNYAEGEDRFCNSKFNISGDNYTVRCQISNSK